MRRSGTPKVCTKPENRCGRDEAGYPTMVCGADDLHTTNGKRRQGVHLLVIIVEGEGLR